jgi:hypothetical protein
MSKNINQSDPYDMIGRSLCVTWKTRCPICFEPIMVVLDVCSRHQQMVGGLRLAKSVEKRAGAEYTPIYEGPRS